MRVLGLDTTGNVCSAALWEDGRIIAEGYLDHKKTHSEGLMPMVDFILQSAETDLNAVDVFAVAIGPGSFTGIRIGVSAIKAFAQGLNKPCAAVNTLDALALNVSAFEGLICPMLDARRQEVYAALYESKGGSVTRVSDYLALPVADILREIAGRKTLFLGDGAAAYRETIAVNLPESLFAPPNVLYQRASSVCLKAFELAQNNELSTAYEIEPFYLRKPQAEQAYERLHG